MGIREGVALLYKIVREGVTILPGVFKEGVLPAVVKEMLLCDLGLLGKRRGCYILWTCWQKIMMAHGIVRRGVAMLPELVRDGSLCHTELSRES